MNPKILPLTRYDIIQVMLKISKVDNWMQIVIDDIILWKKIPAFGLLNYVALITQITFWLLVYTVQPNPTKFTKYRSFLSVLVGWRNTEPNLFGHFLAKNVNLLIFGINWLDSKYSRAVSNSWSTNTYIICKTVPHFFPTSWT